MSTRARHHLPVLLLALAACGPGFPTPVPTSVTPSRGFSGNLTPIIIRGGGFSLRPIEPAAGGDPSLDAGFHATLGGADLGPVERIDEQTLSATVPSGLPRGTKDLHITGPFGTSGGMVRAFTVFDNDLASLTAAITASPGTVTEGQLVTVTLTVTNDGTVPATEVVPAALTVTGDGVVALQEGPSPASAPSLSGNGVSVMFTWTYLATGAGSVEFAGAANAIDTFSGRMVTCATPPTLPARVTVQTPAHLTASFPASGAAAVNQEFTVALTVTNSGGAAAHDVVPAPPTFGPLVTLKPGTGPAPASVPVLAGGASTAFTWTFLAGPDSGTVTFTSSASGTDGNTGTQLTSDPATSGPYTLGAAGLTPTLTASPGIVSSAQALTLTLKVTNPGLASVRNFTVGVPAVSSVDGANAVRVSGPVPAAPTVLAAGQTVTLVWVYTPSLTTGVGTGHLRFALDLAGTDEFSHAPISVQATAGAAVEVPASLGAVLTPSRSPVDTGQAFSLTLTVTNTGVASADRVAATAIAGCSAPTPASATVDPGTPVAFSYASCASATAGTLTLQASASGFDGNDPTRPVTSPTATAQVLVQSPPAVSGALSIPSGIARGLQFTLTLTLTNAGGAAAVVTPGTPAVAAGSTGAVSLASGPSPGSVNVPAGGVATIRWTYNAAAVGTISFTGSASGVDANTGGATPAIAVAPSNAGAIGQAALGALVTASRGTTLIGQQVTFTLTLTNTGTAAVSGIVPTLSVGPAPGTLGPATPASVASLAPGASVPITWTFTPSASTAVTVSASAVGTDVLSLAQVTTNTVASNLVQVQATLGGTVSGLVGSGLQLALSGQPNLAVPGNGAFTFPTAQSSGTAYAITVAAQPTSPWQTCTVANGSGTVGAANISNVAVTCVTNTYTVGGSISGLAGSGLVLASPGLPNLTVASGATSFAFATPAASGSSYAVTVVTQPSAVTQVCTVASGSGTVAGTNVISVAITCVTSSFTVGGTVSGLAGTGLVLRNNAGNNLTIAANGTFTFSTAIRSGLTYAVTVLTQPTALWQTCTVTAGSGTVTTGPVTSVVVTCVTNTYAVGGTASGLATGNDVVLQLNGGNTLTVAANGAFTFATPVASGATYAVTVLTQPTTPSQSCTVTSGSGTIAGAAVTTVAVACVTNTYSVGGTVTGLAGGGLVLQLNGGNNLAVSGASFTFPTLVLSGATYSVTVLTQPSLPSQTCTVTGGSGTVGAANVTTVTVACTTNTYTVGGTVSGLGGSGLVLQLNGGNNLAVSAGPSFTFATPVLSGAGYSVTVLTQPTSPWQTCSVSAGSGTVTSANVTSVVVSCVTNTYALGGTVSGLLGTGLQLATAGEPVLTVPAGATSFTFATPLASGAAYSVSVAANPGTGIAQSCLVSSGASGTIAGAAVTSVAVVCFTNSYTVGGTVSGLTGTGLVLQDNLGDDLPVPSGATSFTFATPVASGAAYSVTVLTQPAGQTCSLTGGSGTVGAASVTSVAVTCTP